jgi:hypothetical protein
MINYNQKIVQNNIQVSKGRPSGLESTLKSGLLKAYALLNVLKDQKKLFYLLFCTVSVWSSGLSDTDMAWSFEKKTETQQYLTPAQAGKIHRDAVAGAYDRREAFYSILVVEQALPMMEVAEYARFSYEELPVTNKKLLFFHSEPIQDLPAAAFAFNGQLDGRFVDYEVEIIEYSGFYYHLVCFRFFNDPEKTRTPLAEMKPIFRIMQDKKPKQPSAVLPEAHFGVGFYLIDNNYYDGLYDFRLITDNAHETLITGHNATSFHPQARLALENNKSGLSYFLIPTPKNAAGEIIRELQKNGLNSHQYKICEGHQHSLLSVSPSSKETTDTKSLCSRIIRMTEAEKEKTRKVLRENRFKLLECTKEQSFFNNRYRHHSFGLEFRFAEQDIVELWFEDNFGMDSLSSVAFTNHSSGFSGRFVFQENQFMERMEYHKSIMESFPVTEPEIKENGPFLISNFNLTETGENIMLASLIKNNLFFHATFNSHPTENSGNNIPLRFALGDFPPFVQREEKFTHHRMAFAMNTAKMLQKPQIITPEELQDLGVVLQFSEKQINHTLYVLNSPLINPELVFDLYLSAQNPGSISHNKSSRIYKFLDLDVNEETFDLIGPKPETRLFQRTMRRGSTLFVLFSLVRGNLNPPCFFYDHEFQLSTD